MEKTERIIAAIRLFCIVLTALLLSGKTPVFAETAVGGLIGVATTWSAAAGPYNVTSDVVIDSGALLTIEAGVTVRFQSGTRLMVQYGSLRALGIAASPILFTSWRDTPGGTPAAGDWKGIQFLGNTNDASTLLEYTTVSYGSTTTLSAASPTFNHCRFDNNSGYALAIDLSSFPHGTGNTAVNNGVDSIRVPAGEMNSSGVWDLTSIPYFLEGAVSVGAAPTVSGITPASVEQGSTVAAVITGTRLNPTKKVTFTDSGITAAIHPGGTDTTLPVQLTVGSAVPLGAVGFTLSTAAGDTSSSTGITVMPPMPLISSITPDRVFVNHSATVSIIGTNFTANTTAYLDDSALVTTYVNATQLQAAVLPQQIAAVGQIQVKNPDPRYPVGTFIVSNITSFTVELPQFVFSPATLALRQADTGATLNLTIPFAAPAGGITANLTSTNTAAATVPATATVPEGATSVTVPVTAPTTTNSHDVVLEVHANLNNWTGNKATVTIRPQPTVNLSPTTTLSGQSFSLTVSVSLTDPAPAGGLLISLNAAPAGVLTVPASLTIAAGATSGQVTVIASGTGTAIITATAAVGSGFFTGDSSQITVKPIQTYGVGPVLSTPVGVNVITAAPAHTQTTYMPLLSQPVGAVVGSVLTGLVPDRSAVGTQNLSVRVNGTGLTAVNAVSIVPATGITVQSGSLKPAVDGNSLEFVIDIAADAPITTRQVVVTAGGKTVPLATAGVGLFLVTRPLPVILGLIPNYGVLNTTTTLTVIGHNLHDASTIAFVTGVGITVGNPLTVNADGTQVTVPLAIDAGAAPGIHAVTITTPGGATPDAVSVPNSYDVRANAGTTYTPIISPAVGVAVAPSAPANIQRTYGPLLSSPVGVFIGAVLTGVQPLSGAIGTTVPITISGSGLSAATGVSFVPTTGITPQSGSFVAAGDGSNVKVTVDIAADAPVTMRTVVVTLADGSVARAAASGVNQFQVTLPQPELFAIQPIRREVGSSFTITLLGKNLTGASLVEFSPATGITVSNPPTMNADGSQATVSVAIAADAPAGERLVKLTAPGGTTSAAVSAVNSFTVTATPGANYGPIMAPLVGVTVALPTAPIPPAVQYGPIDSLPVGVTVTPPAPAATSSAGYGPITSAEVGVTVGSTLSEVNPKVVRPGEIATVTVTGFGLAGVTGLAIQPTTGITIGSVTAAADGLSVTAQVTVDAAIAIGRRQVVLTTNTGIIPVATPFASEVRIGPLPTINSITPYIATVGSTFTLTINGSNLKDLSAIRFDTPDGITVDSIPVWSQDANGVDHVAVTVILAGDANPGTRGVIVVTPYGESSSAKTAANTFTVFKPVARNFAPQEKTRVAARQPESFSSLPRTDWNGDLPSSGISAVLPTRSAGDDRALPSGHAKELLAVASRQTQSYPDRATFQPVSMLSHPVQVYRGPPLDNQMLLLCKLTTIPFTQGGLL